MQLCGHIRRSDCRGSWRLGQCSDNSYCVYGNRFCYGAYMDIEKILKFLYEDSNIYLERKYKRYKDFINKLHDIV